MLRALTALRVQHLLGVRELKGRTVTLSSAVFFAVIVLIAQPAKADPSKSIPTIDLYPTLTWAIGKDEHGVPSAPAGGRARGTPEIDFAITQPLFHGLSFQYAHVRGRGIDSTLGSVATASGKIVNIPTNRDVQDFFRLQYTGIRNVSITAGYFYRSSHDNMATNDPKNLTPRASHVAYLLAAYTTPPIEGLNGATFGAAVQLNENKHHVSRAGLAAEKAAGFSDFDGKIRYGAIYSLNANFPLDRRKGLSAFASWGNGAFDYFDNSPVPYYYYITDVGLTKRFSNTFSLTADVNNLVQHNNAGWPFAAPNTIHRVYFALTAHIHIAP